MLFTIPIQCLLFSTVIVATVEKNVPKCSAQSPDETVFRLTDGTYDRCITAFVPPGTKKPLPILFWFHGAGGNAAHCGSVSDSDFGMSLTEYATKYGFVLICGEALQDIYGHGGQWAIPEVQTDTTGHKCNETDTVDNTYMKNVIKLLETKPETFDTSHIYTSGCSMGSAFSSFSATCMHQWYGENRVAAFATHSTGLKVKGDGLRFPPDNYNKSYGWGECPKCQYFPFVPSKTDLKACLNDNTGDNDFYKSTIELATTWKSLGNRFETHYNDGGHCQIHSFWDIVHCLDDGSGHLLGNGTAPPGYSPSPSPSPQSPSPKPPTPLPPASCLAALRKNCKNEMHNGEECAKCLEHHMMEPNQLNNCKAWGSIAKLEEYYCGVQILGQGF